MIAAAIVCAAVASQAANAYWSANESYNNTLWTDKPGTVSYTGSAYVFLITDTFNQDTLLSSLRGSGSITDYTPATTLDIASGKWDPTEFNNTATSVDPEGNPNGTQYFFVALVKDDNVFLTQTVSGGESGDPTAPTSLSFTVTAGSKKFFDDKTTFAGNDNKTGWYAVPEPTSGLLLLLGVAGLALRRRRA